MYDLEQHAKRAGPQTASRSPRIVSLPLLPNKQQHTCTRMSDTDASSSSATRLACTPAIGHQGGQGVRHVSICVAVTASTACKDHIAHDRLRLHAHHGSCNGFACESAHAHHSAPRYLPHVNGAPEHQHTATPAFSTHVDGRAKPAKVRVDACCQSTALCDAERLRRASRSEMTGSPIRHQSLLANTPAMRTCLAGLRCACLQPTAAHSSIALHTPLQPRRSPLLLRTVQ
jgi:hypothetical protein